MAEYPYIPETITVHLGRPDDASAPNVTVPFLEYIQNVASSEIYPTWPDNAIRANIYAQISFALNRIYTEWYRSRGYDFDITNSTAYDQSFVYGRDLFDNVSALVSELFDHYLARPGAVQPLFAAYCDGRRVQCEGLSQWGTVALAEDGLSPYQILTYYYGDNLDIRTAPVRPLTESYPGIPLRLGLFSEDVRTIQQRLNRISRNYPSIPTISDPSGLFDQSTLNAVLAFQEIFNLTRDGVVGKATWYEIQNIYNAVRRLAELNAEGITLTEAQRQFPSVLREGSTGISVQTLQYYLNVMSRFFPSVPAVDQDGIYGPRTRESVKSYQLIAGLPVDGIVGRETWNSLQRSYDEFYNRYAQAINGVPLFPLPPGQTFVLGSSGDGVRQIQRWLNILSDRYPAIVPLPETGYYGQNTRAAVLAFQQIFNLPATGIVNAFTWEQLYREAEG